MKILIIGNGFIANSLVQRFESEGHKVLVFSRSFRIGMNCKQILGDIFDFENFDEALSWGPNVIIHSAWITTPGIYRDDVSNYRYAEFTMHLASEVADSDVEHLIVLGTCAEYGRQISPSTAGITMPNPQTLYAKQKVRAHNEAIQILADSRTRFTWARVFYPYGPNQAKERLIPKIISALTKKEELILGDTSSTYDWISTRDIASAISWTIRHKLPSQIDIGTSFGFSNLELIQNIENLVGSNNLTKSLDSHNVGNGDVYVAGKDSAIFSSGWKPADSLESGLRWVLNS
jgi:nucleoside-diphosphate-sugar epimerase